jgi:hypothetical protein
LNVDHLHSRPHHVTLAPPNYYPNLANSLHQSINQSLNAA